MTHLADSFEEFICGLEHESLYDSDEDVEDLNEDVDADEEETDRKSSFAGSVLLSKAEWDKRNSLSGNCRKNGVLRTMDWRRTTRMMRTAVMLW